MPSLRDSTTISTLILSFSTMSRRNPAVGSGSHDTLLLPTFALSIGYRLRSPPQSLPLTKNSEGLKYASLLSL